MTADSDLPIPASSPRHASTSTLFHAVRKTITMMRTELAFTPTRTWVGFGLMCLGMFMAILDIQVVATALPTIQNALAISPEAMSWIQTSYLIAEVIAIPLTGWLTRILSMRW